MDGNSLGLMCRAADAALRDAAGAWRTLGVRGWAEGPEPWFGMARKASDLLAPLLGCDPDDVTVGNSTTVNLHQILATFADPRRGGVVLDATHFPTDRYAVESFVRGVRGGGPMPLTLVPPGPDGLLDEADLCRGLAGAGFAVFPAVVYTTGQLVDMKRVIVAARELGVPVAWDCSHSAGVVPHRFRDDGIELAFGCGYKYLNGGPGAAGWLYVHPELRDRPPGLAGWFGCDPARQFEMAAEFRPAADAGRFQIGTPHVLSLAPLLGSLRVLNDAGIDRVRAKSVAQTGFLMALGRDVLGRHGVGVRTPANAARRGGHVTFTHADAAAVSRALRARDVVPDFRPPDMLRFAPAPLYTSFAECEAAVAAFDDVLTTRAYHEMADTDDPVP